ncbi:MULTISPECIES: mannonate dehydratase [Bradyrhizobium]|nr:MULTISPECIES: mannonate dehydratase [Bradyrhizobium]MCG2628200.1 mannonate dehydratase [Bradyrhizobium zhengyangense]MCG2643319.1 mannonate dehydratase [Bradyrhizobium zhengyangense]MCG2670367.1 mannonate dehydratase [Bradyrhizobium zhengyangense]MDN4985898.1 mannonate dehydratase [Bradyrhizobium sp. WYCCWR 13022]MDN5002723.1 mannonate dehydratase [Bradyrhizobium sp. WYCCWR 12677]
MDRRDFTKALLAMSASAGMSGAAVAEQEPSGGVPSLAVRVNDKIRLGGQRNFDRGPVTSRQNMQWHQRWGIRYLDVSLETRNAAPDVFGSDTPDEGALARAQALGTGMGGARLQPTTRWSLEGMMRIADTLQKNDLIWESIRMDSAYIAMAPGPERDRYLDLICENVQTAGRAGVKIISYHWNLTPIRRNRKVQGRGGSEYDAFKLEDNWRDLPPTPAGRVSADDYWERLHVWASRVIPVAAESGVKMACHPYDPGGLPLGYLGVDSFDAGDYANALLKYEKLYDSPHNGFQYDTGVSRESMPEGVDQLALLYGLIKRKKIHQIHFRNVRASQNDFVEVYHDEGDVDLFNIIRLLRDSGGSLLADHSPRHQDDPSYVIGFAFANGYILGLLRAAHEEALKSIAR